VLKECKAHCLDGVKPECCLSAATIAETTPFTDVPKLTPCVQLPGFSTLCSALSNHVSSLRVRSFVAKVALLKLILSYWVTTGRMRLCLTPLHQMC